MIACFQPTRTLCRAPLRSCVVLGVPYSETNLLLGMLRLEHLQSTVADTSVDLPMLEASSAPPLVIAGHSTQFRVLRPLWWA